MNKQLTEKPVSHPSHYDVHSIFKTIQGEGPYSGHPAIFIRLAGCNLQCPWCDTDYTSKRQRMSYGEIVEQVSALAKGNIDQIVVITGGEPFRQNIRQLANILKSIYAVVQIETNGTLEVPIHLSHAVDIVCSPKTGNVHPSIYNRAIAFKYVLNHNSIDPEDGLPIKVLDHSCKPRVARPSEGFTGATYVLPMDVPDIEEHRKNIQAVVDSSLKYGYIAQLQIHKVLKVE